MSLKTASLLRFATIASLVVAIILVIAKSIVWQLTHTLSLQASLVDSALDALASLINFFAVRHALRPADKEHRFGHGKAEALAGLAQSGFIAASAIWLLVEGVHRTLQPEAIHYSSIGTNVMVFATVLTFLLILFQQYVVHRTKSLAISADSLHYQADLLTNIAVLISLYLSTVKGWSFVDIAVGVGIGLYILKSSWCVGREAVNVLMDRELDDDARNRILEIAQSHLHVKGVHDLRTRSSGLQSFIQMHLDIPANLSFEDAHHVSQEVSQTLAKAFPNAEVIIHIDPIKS